MPRHSPASDPHAKALSVKDQQLIQIVDSALAEAAHRSGEWLVCRPGCTQCCIGAFPINQLDALRLRRGLADLELRAPERAQGVRRRARESVARLSAIFPAIQSAVFWTRETTRLNVSLILRMTSLAPCSILKRGIVNSTNPAP